MVVVPQFFVLFSDLNDLVFEFVEAFLFVLFPGFVLFVVALFLFGFLGFFSCHGAFEAGDGLVPPVQFFLDGVVLLVEGVFGCFDLFDQFVELFFAIFCFFLFGDDID